ncbi:MipA/OmpV family protein [Desulfopila aestuarii]|uniref:Outer membrane protein n=1 Tax=Desulfopila aestuarii DSM 18488 TaxID=1121416 RepID=A0A1M7YH24_9BACT|nr:MipA/OmpV family protein [Desulfopila aestuarii]SHO51879.1 outer membrane protein [Desulfopila aestuarii DSM 18488]
MKNALRCFSHLFIASIFSTMLFIDNVSAESDALDEADLWAGIAEDIDEAPGYEDPADKDRNWTVSIGLSGGVSPDYEGSDDYDFGYGPNISASWRDIIFYKGKTLGANIINDKNFKTGPILSWASGRDEDDNDNLDGLGDIDSSVEAGGYVAYRKETLRFRAEVRQDIGSGHDGALVELQGGTTLPFENPRVFVGLGTTWASDKYMESYFGINSRQSAASGYERYNAESGIKDVNVSMTGGYSITNRWRIGGMLMYKRLVGDAADSPIVEDKNQFIMGLGISYHMGSKNLQEEQ